MKTFYSTIALMSMMLIASLGFTSCDYLEDDNVGYKLQGHWFGDLNMYYDGIPARGSDIIFYPEGWDYRQGRGTQIDYYGRYGNTQVRHEFSYRINNEIIYLTFYDEPSLDCMIRDYGLNSDNFWGRLEGRYSSTDFSLRNYERYWKSDGYYGYDYDYDRRYYGGYYTRSAAMPDTLDAQSDTLTAQPKATRGVNRIPEEVGEN